MNFWKILALWLAVPAAFILCSANSTAAQDVKVCISYETNFTDFGLGDFYDDTPPHEYPALHPYVRVYDNDAASYVFQGYAYGLGTANCTSTLSLPASHDFKITVVAKASLGNNNKIYVKDNVNNPTQHSQIVAASWNPSSAGNYTFIYEYHATWKVSNVLAAEGRSIFYYPAGVSGAEIVYYTDEGAYYSGYDDGEHVIVVGEVPRGKKGTMTHETGHALMNAKNNNLGFDDNCSFWESGAACTSGSGNDHCDKCLEYQSCAAAEGFADFYMIHAWNNWNGEDCEYYDNPNSDCE